MLLLLAFETAPLSNLKDQDTYAEIGNKFYLLKQTTHVAQNRRELCFLQLTKGFTL